MHHVESPRAQEWLRSQMFKYAINRLPVGKGITQVSKDDHYTLPGWAEGELSAGNPVYAFDMESAREFEYDSAIVVEWLNNQRIGKNFGMTWEEAVQRSKKWNDDIKNFDDIQSGLETVIEYPEGYKWIKLTNVHAIMNEGDRLKNCLRYKERIRPDAMYYTLRDEKDKSQGIAVTSAIDEVRIVEIRGRENGPVAEEYVKYFRDLKRRLKFKVGAGINQKGVFA